LSAIQDPGKYITSEFVGAKPVFNGGLGKLILRILFRSGIPAQWRGYHEQCHEQERNR
jgi:hypothetical protein